MFICNKTNTGGSLDCLLSLIVVSSIFITIIIFFFTVVQQNLDYTQIWAKICYSNHRILLEKYMWFELHFWWKFGHQTIEIACFLQIWNHRNVCFFLYLVFIETPIYFTSIPRIFSFWQEIGLFSCILV